MTPTVIASPKGVAISSWMCEQERSLHSVREDERDDKYFAM